MALGVVDFLLSGFTDNSGNPLNGGKVYTYAAGTLTPKSVYTDNLGVTPETNPVILDSNGRKQVYSNGSYKFVIKTSADVTLYTFDNLFFDFNYATTQAEISALDSANTEILINTAITLTGNLTITNPVRFLGGGSIVTNGFTLTLNGQITAGATKIFTTAAGQVVFGIKSTLYVLLEWFGATGDGSTDDTVAIQLAASIAAVNPTDLPIRPLNRTYSISAITCPRQMRFITEDAKRSTATFKGRSSVAMFTINALADSFVTFKGCAFDANNLSTPTINIVNSDNVYIENCSFLGVQAKGIQISGGIFCHIINCEFVGSNPSNTAIFITGLSNANYIERCNFGASSATYCISTDVSWTGDTLLIDNCTFGATNCASAISLLKSNTAGNLSAFLRNCRIDMATSVAAINIGQYAWGVSIRDCVIVKATPYNVLTDAGYTTVENCWMSLSTTACIGLTTNANKCRIGLNVDNAGAAYIANTSTYNGGLNSNMIDRPIRRGTTANRLNGVEGGSLGSQEYGVMYMDTTLDADGKIIFWNGTGWFDATGAAA